MGELFLRVDRLRVLFVVMGVSRRCLLITQGAIGLVGAGRAERIPVAPIFPLVSAEVRMAQRDQLLLQRQQSSAKPDRQAVFPDRVRGHGAAQGHRAVPIRQLLVHRAVRIQRCIAPPPQFTIRTVGHIVETGRRIALHLDLLFVPPQHRFHLAELSS